MDKRTEYVESLSAQMVEWDMQISRLKDAAAISKAETRADLADAIAMIQRRRDEAAVKLMELTDAGDDAWEGLKDGTELIWEEVRTILHDTVVLIK